MAEKYLKFIWKLFSGVLGRIECTMIIVVNTNISLLNLLKIPEHKL